MIKHIYTHDGKTLIRTEEANPVCREDFCDRCGDCLYCDGDKPCYPSEGEHFWVEYEEK